MSIFYFLFTMTMYVVGDIGFPCPKPLCECRDKEAICSGENLTYIPRLPERVERVTFINGNIGILSKELIENLTFNRRIGGVNFTSNGIFEIKPDTFANLTLIKVLTFASEYSLSVENVRNALIDINKRSNNLIKLTLVDNGWSILPDDMFKFLKANKIRKIILRNNNIKVLNLSLFSEVKKLTNLDVTFNQITQIIPGMMLNLRHLLLGNNEIIDPPKFCTEHENESAFPRLLKLSLNNNKISELGQFRCLFKLECLILDSNLIRVINSDTFTELKHLEKLYLIAAGRPLMSIEEGAFNISSLNKLSLRNCHFNFNRLSTRKLSKIFSSCQNLEILDLAENYINSTILTPMIYPLTKLKTLNLEATRLSNLPEYIFPKMQYLNQLILRKNMIRSWDGSKVFSNITSLTYLDLYKNLISVIDETSFPLPLLKNLKSIFLANNQFSCTCELMWFVNWLRKTNITVIQYPYLYYCTQPAELNHVLLRDYNPTVESCTPWNPLFTMAISMCTFGSLVITALGIFLKCHRNIKNYVYLLRVKHRKRYGYLPIENNDDYQYHAFVVYCDVNRIWVHNEFVKRLENKEGFKFCIHHRDFVAGATITTNIDTFLKESWKVVVIMSNALAKSEWCQWEIDIVQERRRRQGRDALVLIMLENINSKHMTSPLRTLLDSTPYIRYKKGFGEDLFWKAVVESLRKSIGQPPVSVL